MMSSPLFCALTILLGLASFCHAADQVIEKLDNGYIVTVPSWEVPITGDLDGPTVLQHGTIQEVYANMSANYAGWNDTFPIPSFADISKNATTYRDPIPTSHYCGRWPRANEQAIQDGIEYLWKVGGRPRLDPGPGTCGRVSCSYKAAIYWCNDHTTEFRLNSFNDIASGAYQLYENCRDHQTVSGQVFYSDKWNVIVREDKNRC